MLISKTQKNISLETRENSFRNHTNMQTGEEKASTDTTKRNTETNTEEEEEVIFKKKTKMVFDASKLINSVESREKDDCGFLDLLCQAVIEKIDNFVDYRYSKNKFGLHKIELIIENVHPSLKSSKALANCLSEHLEDDVESHSLREGTFSCYVVVEV